jgi:hypothetical protein
MVHHNLVLCHCELGDFVVAQEYLEAHRELYASLNDSEMLNLLAWVEGRIAVGQGRTAEAEAHFVAVREAFVDQQRSFSTALVSLDLAALYLELGRTGEVRDLSETTFALFDSQAVHREAIAAWMLFHRAAEAERVTAELIGRLRSYFQLAEKDPSYRFEG